MSFISSRDNLMRQYGFTRKIATLIVHIQRGVDSLDFLATLWETNRVGVKKPFVGMGEYLTISQYLSSQA